MAHNDESEARDANKADAEDVMALAPRPDNYDAEDGEDPASDGTTSASLRPWRVELARWLLTLNPGRTQDEYAKAVGYFFTASGAPQSLDLISTDLLFAYRGALAMRAERARTSRGARGPGAATAARLERLWVNEQPERQLPGEHATGQAEPAPPLPPSRLAPATVNLRLTALRQFLRFASMREPLPNLTLERIQHALRRLSIERRRPYQILSEEEWPDFLSVARAPLSGAANSAPQLATTESASERPALWGRTRAERARAHEQARVDGETDSDDRAAGAAGSTSALGAPQRAHDGRTGARTAQRDYALVALALTTGLRAIELSLLDVGDLTHERHGGQSEWWLTLPDEKTKGQRGGRTLPLAPNVATVILDYLQYTGRSYGSAHDRNSPLFLALPNGPHPASAAEQNSVVSSQADEARRLRPEQIRAVINRIETQWLAAQEARDGGQNVGAGERRISPHALRHSAAIALLKGSDAAGRPPASVEHVRGWLGHFDIRTTQRYLDHLSSRDERRRFTISTNLGPNQVNSNAETTARHEAPAEHDSM